MRKSKAEAAETRKRIVETASEEFRRKGIDGTSVADLMAAAGLTHGGFYRHFDSKDQLIAEASAASMVEAVEQNAAAARRGAKPGFNAIIENYLTTRHRDQHAEGCPFAALGSELARADATAREAASEGFLRLVEVIARQLPGTKAEPSKDKALFVLSAMVGALTMSRMVNDPALSKAILQQTKRHLAVA